MQITCPRTLKICERTVCSFTYCSIAYMTDNTVNSVDEAIDELKAIFKQMQKYISDENPAMVSILKCINIIEKSRQQPIWHTIEGSTGDEFPYKNPKLIKKEYITVILPNKQF